MAPPPTSQAIKSLYHNMLRSSQSFSSYNFREYFIRRTKDSFREMQAESDPTRLSTLYAAAQRESGVIRRSAIVNQLYRGPKLAVELQDKEVEAREMEGHALETGLERGNN
ncbi:hypothetical protein FA13DRAFT_1738216 [Coprinellus micaceus]|uniref:Complex 1 LYR protein domain-containing protein n=1 Tax=Coprinellus micaceus TaxID=71717 RepID=A0A4Y7SUG0_COPMI|nr:hypothetical protein FA13DRAFT_1738216 [Coprinellus micaceus]